MYVENLPHNKKLVSGEEDPLLPHLIAHIESAKKVDIAVAFIQESGINLLHEHLRDLLIRGGSARILTGDYMEVVLVIKKYR